MIINNGTIFDTGALARVATCAAQSVKCQIPQFGYKNTPINFFLHRTSKRTYGVSGVAHISMYPMFIDIHLFMYRGSWKPNWHYEVNGFALSTLRVLAHEFRHIADAQVGAPFIWRRDYQSGNMRHDNRPHEIRANESMRNVCNEDWAHRCKWTVDLLRDDMYEKITGEIYVG